MRTPLIIALATVAFASSARAGAETAKELFPVRHGVNAERGFAMAVNGDWLAVGAPREDAAERKDAGVVYLFYWSGTAWEQRARLVADPPQPNAQLGSALAMRNGILAAGAPGEGAVYLFGQDEGSWSPAGRLTAVSHGAGTFGRSLALDDDRLAVGAADVHGETDGAVYLYKVETGLLEQIVRPRPRQKGERFGSAVSLAGNVLVAGAPGYDLTGDTPTDDVGAAYVFRYEAGRFRPKAKLLPPLPSDGLPPAWQQLGAAVATDGERIFAGAPTADSEFANTGAVHEFVRSGTGWVRQGLLEARDLAFGDQLGSSLSLSGDFLVAGAPAPPPGTGTGKVHVFRRDGVSWEETRLVPGNAEIRDLAGFAAAVDGERVVVGGVLGDQGDGAAGAAWSFRCPAGDACAEEAEAVARDTATGTFGASVALTEQYLAVGSPAPDDDSAGLVYLYRRARNGWRQEVRLLSPAPSFGDPGFGTSVALNGQLLAVGAPRSRTYQRGVVYPLFRDGRAWVFEMPSKPVDPPLIEAFGTSVALTEDLMAIGARGAFYSARRIDHKWSNIPGRALGEPADLFGASVSLFNKFMAIGAPGEEGGVGAIYGAVLGPEGWILSQKLPGTGGARGFGSSVAIGSGALAVGTPGSGIVYLVEGSGRQQPLTPRGQTVPGLGASLSLLGTQLAVGAPNPQGLGHAFLFGLDSRSWRELTPLPSLLPGDGFGSAVALSSHFAVVTSPGRGDRVTVFELLPEEGENP